MWVTQLPEHEFQQYLRRLVDDVILVDSKFELCFYLLGRKQDSLEAMNVSPAFFQLVLDALFNDSVVSIAKLYEGQRSDRNLLRFLDFVETNINIFSQEAQESRGYSPSVNWSSPTGHVNLDTVHMHRVAIESKRTVLNNLFFRRDKVYAHSDDEYFYDRITLKDDAPLSFGQLRELIKMAGSILNEYSVAYNGAGQVFRAANALDADKLLKVLQDYVSSRKGGLTSGCT